MRTTTPKSSYLQLLDLPPAPLQRRHDLRGVAAPRPLLPHHHSGDSTDDQALLIRLLRQHRLASHQLVLTPLPVVIQRRLQRCRCSHVQWTTLWPVQGLVGKSERSSLGSHSPAELQAPQEPADELAAPRSLGVEEPFPHCTVQGRSVRASSVVQTRRHGPQHPGLQEASHVVHAELQMPLGVVSLHQKRQGIVGLWLHWRELCGLWRPWLRHAHTAACPGASSSIPDAVVALAENGVGKIHLRRNCKAGKTLQKEGERAKKRIFGGKEA
eukprot:scaffold1971_cov356-Pinguiococcus_pyrenoidosus.AAC.3